MRKYVLILVLLPLLVPCSMYAQTGLGGGLFSDAAGRITSTTFLGLGAPANSTIRYVTDGTQGTFPCTGGGTGAVAFRIGGAWVCPTLSTAMTPSYPLLAPNGSAAAPSYSFSSLPSTGMYAAAGPNLLFAQNGAQALSFTGSQLATFAGHVSIEGVTSTGATGTGLLVFGSSPTIVTPTIASFVNAAHNHQNAAGGGTLDAAAIASGTFTLAGARFANQGTTTTVLHGNAAGNPSFAAVTPSDASGNTTGTGNFVLASTPTLASPSISGNTTFSANAFLISNSSLAVQDTGTNTRTVFRVMPHGTVANVPAAFEFYGTDFSADGTNYERFTINAKGSGDTNYVVSTGAGGTGTVRPLQLTTGANSGIVISAAGNTTINGTTTLGSMAMPTSASAGTYLVATTSNTVAAVAPALTHAKPADQTGNATSTFKMNGLGAAAAPCTITPVATGRVVFTITGQLAQTTTADGITTKLAFGTGAAPANAATATGTVISATITHTALTGALEVPFAITASTTGLTLSTAVWFDLQVANVTGGTASITNVDCTAYEL